MSIEEKQSENVEHSAVGSHGSAAECQLKAIALSLREARELRSMSIEHVADEMRLDVATVQAVEEGRVDVLGAPVFIKGHLRRFGKVVGVSDSVMQHWCSAWAGLPTPADPIPVVEDSATPKRRLTRWVGWGAASVASLFAVITLVGKLAPTTEIEQTSAQQPAPPVVTLVQPEQTTSVETSKPNSILASIAPIASASAHEVISEKERSEALGKVKITMRFTADSWVEIQDASQKTLLQEIGHANEVREITGAPPLRVILGATPAVQLMVNGQSATVPAKRVYANVGRFTIDTMGAIN